MLWFLGSHKIKLLATINRVFGASPLVVFVAPQCGVVHGPGPHPLGNVVPSTDPSAHTPGQVLHEGLFLLGPDVHQPCLVGAGAGAVSVCTVPGFL